MNMNNVKILSVAMGVTAVGLGMLSTPASAITISPVTTPPDPPSGWTDLGWVVEGKGGGNTWEIALEDANYNVKTDRDWTWENGDDVPWQLDWNETANEVTFKLGAGTPSERTLSFTSSPAGPSKWNGFSLWTRATTKANKVDPGTNVLLEVLEIRESGEAAYSTVTDVSSSATSPASGTNITKNFFTTGSDNIDSMRGIVNLSWTGVNPQQRNASSRVGFKIKGFDPLDPPEPPSQLVQSLPEPGSIFSLLALGTLGAFSGLKNKLGNKG